MARKKKTSERIEPSFKKKPATKPATGKSSVKKGAKNSAKSGAKARSTKSGSKRRASKSARGKTKSSNFLVRFVKSSIYWCFVLGIWGAIGIGGIFAFYGAQMPNATTWEVPKRPPNVKIVSLDDQLIANRGATGGEALLLSDMSPYIPQAVIAIEDRRFYHHFGIDPIGLARAMYSNISAGRTVQGGSTLTQQLAKNLFLSPERTLERKVQEVLLAVWLERNFTKDQILEMYLNRVYFGSGAYGVQAASRRYFQKPARDVNLAEAALLAGLLKAPSRLSPARNPDAAEARGQIVLSSMHRAGFIDERDATTAMTQPQTKAMSYWTGSENFAADRVMDDIKALVGDIEEDLVVETTLNLDLQRHAEYVLRATLDKNGRDFNVKEGALVGVDQEGAIRVLIGGRNYATSQFDRAVEAKRQPGSAFKPFVYTAALEQGRTPSSIRNDAPVKIGKWTPKNYDEKYRGAVTLNYALSKSLNTIAAQLVMEVGPKTVIRTAHRLGIESKLQTNASIALGTSEVSLLELTSAYAPFMNGGYKATPHLIKRISTASGKVLYRSNYSAPPRVLSSDVVHNMNVMLSEVVHSGTGKKAQISGWQVAGKTGTSQAFRDALFVGYTANLTLGVWLGNDDGTSTKKVTGGGLPADIWRQVMTYANQGAAVASLPRVTVPTPEGEPAGGIGNERLSPLAEIRNFVETLQPVPTGENTSSIPIPISRNELTPSETPFRAPSTANSQRSRSEVSQRSANTPVRAPTHNRESHQNPALTPPGALTGVSENNNPTRPNSILDVILGQ